MELRKDVAGSEEWTIRDYYDYYVNAMEVMKAER